MSLMTLMSVINRSAAAGADLEASRIPRYASTAPTSSAFEQRAEALGIAWARQGGTACPEAIYPMIDLPLEKSTTWAADTGDAFAKWLGDYLGTPEQADVVQKLNASGLPDQHAFVIVPPSTQASGSGG
jgi:hypothetical protein